MNKKKSIDIHIEIETELAVLIFGLKRKQLDKSFYREEFPAGNERLNEHQWNRYSTSGILIKSSYWGGFWNVEDLFFAQVRNPYMSVSIICRIIFNTPFILLEIKVEMSNLDYVFLDGDLYRVT